MKHRRSGFTLIEILIVIGIVALLAALMLPALNSARDHARSVHCAQNQRQLAAAFINYTGDWDGLLPRWYTVDGGPRVSVLGLRKGQRDWATDILPYIQDESLFLCPNKRLVRGFGFNLWLSRKEGFAVADVAFPTRTTIFAEIAGGSPLRDIYDFVPGSAPEGWPVDSRFQFEPRHGGGGNLAFVDGHVKWTPSSPGTHWPADADKHLDASAPYRELPFGSYWWPSAASPSGG